VGWAHQFNDLPRFYSRAKVVVLGSLAEGKNRVIQEAMCCNTPVVCCEELNWHIRGSDRLFPEGAGLLARFEPESFADAIHRVIHNQSDFAPRKSYLRWSGRRRFLNTCVDKFPYYARAIPDYVAGQTYSSFWVDLAIQDNYRLSLHDFLYGRNNALQHPKGLAQIGETMQFYFTRFGVWFSPRNPADTNVRKE
jgi:glycosyltransferase involved in cell wall biosynthesis